MRGIVRGTHHVVSARTAAVISLPPLTASESTFALRVCALSRLTGKTFSPCAAACVLLLLLLLLLDVSEDCGLLSHGLSSRRLRQG